MSVLGGLSPVTAVLLADTKEFSAKFDEAAAKMGELGAASDTLGQRFTAMGGKLATAVLGAGVAVGAFALDEGVKLNDTMDNLQQSTGLSSAAIKTLTSDIIGISNKTGAATADLATAYTSIYQSGTKGAAALTLLDVAAKGALATNTNVTSTTQTLIAVQALHLKGTKNLAATMGVLVAGSHEVVGGLSAEATLLQGKVGAAFSEYGYTLKQAIEYGSIFSKVGLPTKSISTLVTGLGKILMPIHTVTESNGKLTHGISSTYLAIEKLGLKYSKVASDVRTGNLAGLLLYLKDVANQTKEPLSVLLNTVLGSGGSVSGSLLLKNLGAVTTVTKSLQGAGTGTLNQAFVSAADQFGNKLKIIENQLKNSAAEFGLKLLPYIADAATFFENALQSLESHPVEQKALEIDLGTTFVAAIGVKFLQALNNAKQTGLLAIIARNTAAGAAGSDTSDAELGLVGASGVGETKTGVLAAVSFPQAVGLFAAGVVSFEGTSYLLKTKLGGEIGNWATTVGGSANVFHDAVELFATKVEASTSLGVGGKNYLKGIGGTGLYNQELAAIKAGNTDLAQKLYNELATLEHNNHAGTSGYGITPLPAPPGYGVTPLPKKRPGGKSTLTAKVAVHLH
jgi:TP901 family phage tail tape measure protein